MGNKQLAIDHEGGGGIAYLYPRAWAFSLNFKDAAVSIYPVYPGVYTHIPPDVPN